MKAQEVIHRIQHAAPFPKFPAPKGLEGKEPPAPRAFPTCDVIHIGDPEREVKKIATTFMATVDVVRKAIEQNVDMIITHEPTFHSGREDTEWLENDAAYASKKQLLEDSGIVIWRFHDGMHFQNPDLIYAGWNAEMGWTDASVSGLAKHEYLIPETTVADLAAQFKQTFSLDKVRVIGAPNTKVRKVGVLVGGGSLGLGDELMPAKFMMEKNLDVLVCGEITEWTSCSYVRDAAQLGLNKAMIILGHEVTEEPGMKHLPEWLQPILPELEICFIKAGEPIVYL